MRWLYLDFLDRSAVKPHAFRTQELRASEGLGNAKKPPKPSWDSDEVSRVLVRRLGFGV